MNTAKILEMLSTGNSMQSRNAGINILMKDVTLLMKNCETT
jgi:hypothetical protein